jgi:hypothetical protein
MFLTLLMKIKDIHIIKVIDTRGILDSGGLDVKVELLYMVLILDGHH